MSPTIIVALIVIFGIICTIGMLYEPASDEQSVQPETMDQLLLNITPEPEGPTTCPSCGELALYSTIGTYTEQFGQGTTTIEGVTYWNCRNCMYSYDNH